MDEPPAPSLFELAQQALSSTERGYDLLATKFEATPFRTPDALLVPFFEHVFQSGTVARALDVACGTGAALALLRPQVTERLTGFDFSRGMLDEAARRLAGIPGTARLELVNGDARLLPYDAEFDLVHSAGAFGHFVGDDEDLLLDGIRRALVRGGRFVFLTGPKPPWRSPQRWLAHAFNGAMHVRNALVAPKFVMIYLTFTWPEVRDKLARHGFAVDAKEGLFPKPFERGVAVTARRR